METGLRGITGGRNTAENVLEHETDYEQVHTVHPCPVSCWLTFDLWTISLMRWGHGFVSRGTYRTATYFVSPRPGSPLRCQTTPFNHLILSLCFHWTGWRKWINLKVLVCVSWPTTTGVTLETSRGCLVPARLTPNAFLPVLFRSHYWSSYSTTCGYGHCSFHSMSLWSNTLPNTQMLHSLLLEFFKRQMSLGFFLTCFNTFHIQPGERTLWTTATHHLRTVVKYHLSRLLGRPTMQLSLPHQYTNRSTGKLLPQCESSDAAPPSQRQLTLSGHVLIKLWWCRHVYRSGDMLYFHIDRLYLSYGNC